MNTPDKVYERIVKAAEAVRRLLPEEHKDFKPKLALILGSGLGGFGSEIDVVAEIPYRDIEGMPVSTVEGHKGQFIFGYCGGAPVVLMQGRVHYYEGYSMEDVVMPVRVMRLLGADFLFLTNAAGGADPTFSAGDFMLITDQIMNFVPSPLIGGNVRQLGTRFPDMSEIYDKQLRKIISETAEKLNISLKQGVYCQLTGPNFETPAEVRMARILGADALGMSTACEAVAARHCGFRVCGISCISNLACGLTETPLSHQEVQETADRVAPLFTALVKRSIEEICKL